MKYYTYHTDADLFLFSLSQLILGGSAPSARMS